MKLYPPETHKETWKAEAEERGTSMIQYLQDLIQEARYLREQGQLKLGDKRKVEQLQQRVEELEQQLESQSSNRVTSQTQTIDEELVEKILSENYTPFDQLLEELLKQPEFRRRVRLDLETGLYKLGDEARVVFRRGKGWKHNSGGDK
ncbi:hypothetical protein C499_09062 [Halogeometricum borinquense DSM 11551]|uniref:Uncharacterized protein n=1 Tax=Halogeometricum borinquense (strain ATCC 700274 / DSM 11551 / JCM 10706 / KCTC 4070 / PR3) TaxID=469382 RepID=L9UU62_HALBP|nr:hypothetical protein C499_09062 [Halogeometricum borinquense DSM 11551]